MVHNNLCASLIVYGSYAPGGSNHLLVNHLPGEWQKGFILGGKSTHGDEVYPGEDVQIEAWLIKFEDCNAPMFSEERFGQDIKLFQRWEQLDAKLGADMGRTQRSWWPEGSEPVRGSNGQQVVNIYLAKKIYPSLNNFLDSPHPEDRMDPRKLWSQQLTGNKKYDSCEFLALIKDATLKECVEMFDEVPNIESFLDRLKDFYGDMAYPNGYLLKQDGSTHYFYALPKPDHQIDENEAQQLVRDDIAQKATFLESDGQKERATILRELTYSFDKIPVSGKQQGIAWAALLEADELIQDEVYMKDHNMRCIREACYGIAANYILPNFLLQDYSEVSYDFTLPYKIWKGGYSYEIHENICYIQAFINAQ